MYSGVYSIYLLLICGYLTKVILESSKLKYGASERRLLPVLTVILNTLSH